MRAGDMQQQLGHGVVLADKPDGMSSARVVAGIRKLPGVNKAGHTGTLDPFATGLMICPINQATRISRFLLAGDKQYEARIRLGAETDTQDRTGEIIRRHKGALDIPCQTVEAVLAEFEGPIQQIPPAYSALKHKGVPLYKLARQGTPVQKPARRVTIYALALIDFAPPHLEVRVRCSAGTYLRTLAADLGKRLGCGAYLADLRRTESCGFSVAQALPFSRLAEIGDIKALRKHLIPTARALGQMAEVRAADPLVEWIRQGRELKKGALGRIPPSGKSACHPAENGGEWIKVIDAQGTLVAILHDDPGSARYQYGCVFPSS